jgi:UDP-N-acetylglucosamine diphosphorylase/glucosamine-1-phosphate N-acetyltransferase
MAGEKTMLVRLFIFEDDKYDRFLPLTWTRPAYELRCGAREIRHLITSHFTLVDTVLLCRDYLEPVLSEKSGAEYRVNDLHVEDDDKVYLVNGRLFPPSDLREILDSSGENQLLIHGDDMVGWHGSGRAFKTHATRFGKLHQKGQAAELERRMECVETKAEMPSYLWELVERNGAQIDADFEWIREHKDLKHMFEHSQVDDQALIYDVDRVYIERGSQIDGQVVLDARGGPIIIDEKVHIQPHTRIEGPCFVGSNSILVGGKIRGGTSIGPGCRVGGEVEQSIFLGYCNKYHEGFLGHSYVGEWVNLGALTTNSDLKNNYGAVKVEVNGKPVDSGQTKVGAFIGDHAKIGIGTLLNTGVCIGFSSNVFGGGMVRQKSVPSFFWGGADGGETYRLEEAMKTAETVMKRRGQKLSAAQADLFKKLFELTDNERGE